MERPPAFLSGFVRLHAAPAIVLATGVLCAVGAALYLARGVEQTQEARFHAEVAARVEALRDRMETYTAMLRAARGLFESLGEEPDTRTFARFVASLELPRHYPGIQGIGWAKALRPEERHSHEAQMRRGGRPEYRVWPEGDRDFYSSIIQLEPLDWRNERAIGFDMFSEPTRREAMEKARDTGEVAASAKVELVQEVDADRQAGFLMYIPVYGREPRSVADRRRLLVGWVYAPFRAADLLGRTAEAHGSTSVRLSVFDGTVGQPDALLYAEPPGSDPARRTHLEWVDIAGRLWTLSFSATDGGAFALTDRILPWAVLAAGLAVSTLLFLITRGVAMARARAEQSALRASFLAEAGKVLSASMEAEETVPDVAALAARRIAHGCIVLVLEVTGPSWFAGHRDPAVAREAAALLRGAAPIDAAELGFATVLSSGHPFVRHRLHIGQRGGDRVGAALLRDLSVRAALTVPLYARGQTLGAIALLSSARRAHFDTADVQLGEGLARLVSSAIESSRLYRRAQEAVAARDEFLSIASHELKTPLTSLVLHTDSLRAAARRGTLDQAAAKVELIRRSADRLSRLVSSLLDISRISAGRLDLEIEEVDLADVAREVVARFEDEAVRAGCTLVLQANPVKGRWDRMRIDQVLTNLLANALKYGPGKPVVVRVEPEGDLALLSVRDYGIGIPEDDQRRIFQRFERAVSKRNYGGFGLGLWIVRQIVETLGGTVRVESVPGEGSLFVVEIARGLHAAAPAAEDRPRPSAPSP